MKADTEKMIDRTAGDTYPILVKLTRRTDAGDVAIGDEAEVELRIRAGGTVATIEGIARGEGSGVFAFPPDALPDTLARVPFAIVVTEGEETVTIARGDIRIAAGF